MAVRNLSNLLFRAISMAIFAICLLLFNAGLAEASTVLYYGQSYSPYEMRYTYSSQVKTVFTSDNGTIKPVALDTSNGKLYFADPLAGIIYQSNLTGSTTTPYLSGVYAEGLAVDAPRSFFYYTQSHTDDSNIEHYNVVRADLTNPLNSPTILYTTETGTPEAITVAENGDVYFSDPHESVATIYKVPYGTSNPVAFITDVHAYGLAVQGEFLYFSEAHDPNFKIRKVRLSDKSVSDFVYVSSTGAPKAMTIAGSDLYVADMHSSVAKILKINLASHAQSTVLSNVNAGGIAVLINTPPQVTVNTGIITNENKPAIISNTKLQTTDSESTDPGDLVYTLLTVPGKGKLTKDGSEMAVNAEFTQSDLNSNLIRYVPNPDENGNDSFTFNVNDGMGEYTSGTNTFEITINSANSAPTFIKGEDQTILEDAGAQTIVGWATGMSVGPADESGQTYEFSCSNYNNSLFDVQPQVAHDGTLTYTPKANAYGVATVEVTIKDDGGVENDGVDHSTQSFTITITGINDAPSFTVGANQTVPEDSGPQAITNWASGISAGPMENDQTLVFSVSNNNNSLFSAQPAISANGTLTYTTAENSNGSATVTVTLKDNGGTDNGGVDTGSSQDFTITVTSVNDAPVFTKGADQIIMEDSSAQTITNWATGMSVGPSDESGQTYEFSCSNDNNSLFDVQPQVAYDGTLTYTPKANAYGIATVTVTMTDSGDTANGGINSSSQTFTITITGINEAPSFTGGTNQTVLEDAGPQTIAGWASGISAGPMEYDQTLVFSVSNSNNRLFSAQPAISANGTLTYTTAENSNGSATVTVTLKDNGGTDNGGVDTSSSQDFTITVIAVNDAPTFTKGADQTIAEGAGAQMVNWATGMSVGPADESGQTYTFSCSNDNNSLFDVQPQVAHDGTLTYTPASTAYGSATVSVTMTDNGGTLNGGVDTSSQSFVISVTSVNDPPAITVPGPQSILEDNTLTFTGANAISIADPDAGLNPIELGITVDNGVLSLNGTNGLSFSSGDGSADSTMLFTGTLENINQALNGMIYIPASNYSGSAILTINVNDQGNTGDGGELTDSNSVNIEIAPVNDAPTLDAIADLTLQKNPGQQTVNLTGISPGGGETQNLTLTATSDNPRMIPDIAVDYTSPDATGRLTFTPVKSGRAIITVLLKDDGNNINGGVNTQTIRFSVVVADSHSGGSGSSGTSAERPILDNPPVIDLKNDMDSTASIAPKSVNNLVSGNQALIVKNQGITVEFPPKSLMGPELEDSLKKTGSVLEIKVKAISETEKEKLFELAPLGQSTGIFEIGGTIFDLSAQFTTTSANGTNNTVKITSFPEPVAVTIDLSNWGELSPAQISGLTGVRFEKDDSGKITIVKLGGTYNPVTKTFTFYTDRFSLYGVLRAEKLVNINLVLNSTTATVNGASKALDVGPILINNRTMVPFRFVGEAFGAKVDWLANTGTVVIILDNKEIRLTVDEKVPGVDVSPVIVQGRTFVPIRYISETLGAYVKWFPSSRKIEIVK